MTKPVPEWQPRVFITRPDIGWLSYRMDHAKEYAEPLIAAVTSLGWSQPFCRIRKANHGRKGKYCRATENER